MVALDQQYLNPIFSINKPMFQTLRSSFLISHSIIVETSEHGLFSIIKLTHSNPGTVSHERRLLTFEGNSMCFDEMPDLLDKQVMYTYRFKGYTVF